MEKIFKIIWENFKLAGKENSDTFTPNKLIPKVLAGIQWFLSKSGPCSQSYLEAGGFAKSSPEREIANIQFHFFPSFVIDQD
ncbi:MAG: hypothetical protein Ct9H300mP5_4180 [Candidatus Pelagibacterales bacterium]|nr:MAG: hypothetical protein Ct9H300mP5_4180 [Pelagibacterales bacterium]